jgi:hypothetical protein
MADDKWMLGEASTDIERLDRFVDSKRYRNVQARLQKYNDRCNADRIKKKPQTDLPE